MVNGTCGLPPVDSAPASQVTQPFDIHRLWTTICLSEDHERDLG